MRRSRSFACFNRQEHVFAVLTPDRECPSYSSAQLSFCPSPRMPRQWLRAAVASDHKRRGRRLTLSIARFLPGPRRGCCASSRAPHHQRNRQRLSSFSGSPRRAPSSLTSSSLVSGSHGHLISASSGEPSSCGAGRQTIGRGAMSGCNAEHAGPQTSVAHYAVMRNQWFCNALAKLSPHCDCGPWACECVQYCGPLGDHPYIVRCVWGVVVDR